jgi:hypothetical protein
MSNIEKIKVLEIPANQKKFLDKLLFKAEGNHQTIFAVEVIIQTIETVENIYPGKGQEILKGAHVVMQDPELYKQIIDNSNNRNRISSHYRGNKIDEKRVDLKHKSDFLIGLSKADECNIFWMQLENTKVDFSEGLIRGSILLVLHMLDYLYYKFTGQNVGPCGLSEYTETKPIVIEHEKIQDYFGKFDKHLDDPKKKETFVARLSNESKSPDSNSVPAA